MTLAGPVPATLQAILPAGAAGVERGAITDERAARPVPELYAAEHELIAGASDRRRCEFAEARACAREALAALGVAPGPIPATPGGAPVWPEGVVGSITHKGGYRAAVVAFATDIRGIGIDAELDAPLPEGVLGTIASRVELDQVQALLAREPGIAWDRLLFCAKEAAVKAASPLGISISGVRGVEVHIDTSGALFRATGADGDKRAMIDGSWARSLGGFLAVAAAS